VSLVFLSLILPSLLRQGVEVEPTIWLHTLRKKDESLKAMFFLSMDEKRTGDFNRLENFEFLCFYYKSK